MRQFKTIVGYILIGFLVLDLGYARFTVDDTLMGKNTRKKKRSASSSSGTNNTGHVARSSPTAPTSTAAAITPVANYTKKPKAKSVTFKELRKGMMHVMECYPQLRLLWIQAADLLSFIQKKYSPLKDKEVEIGLFVRAMNSDGSFGGQLSLRQYKEGNFYGLFHNQFNNGDTAIHCYCFGQPGAPLPEEIRPSRIGFSTVSMDSAAVKSKVEEAESNLKSSGTESTHGSGANKSDNGADGSHDERPNRGAPGGGDEEERRKTMQSLEKLKGQNYFHTKEAWNLFVPKDVDRPADIDGCFNDECETIVLNAIFDRIDKLDEGIEGWFNVTQNAEPDDDITSNQRRRIERRCQYVRIALVAAVKHMPDGSWNWGRCAQYSIEVMSEMFGIEDIRCERTVRNWHQGKSINFFTLCYSVLKLTLIRSELTPRVKTE